MLLFKKKPMSAGSVKIVLKPTGNLFYVILKSRIRLKLLLDSGASRTQIADYALHNCIYEKTGETFSTYGVGGSIEAEEIQLLLSATDASYTRNLMSACTTEDKGFCFRMRKLHVDGLLGMDFLKDSMIDLSNRVLIIPEIK